LPENKTIEKAAARPPSLLVVTCGGFVTLSRCMSRLRRIQETNLAQYHAVKAQTDEL
jgi:hypothetical protein